MCDTCGCGTPTERTASQEDPGQARTIEVQRGVLALNDDQAQQNRERLRAARAW